MNAKKNVILSTKKLSPGQKDILQRAKIPFFDYDAMTISHLDFKINKVFQNFIFTSQNAVRAFLNKFTEPKNCFCVGEKTKSLLEENGYKVIKTARNASILGEIIIKNYQKESFLFLCGNKRREELPSILKENNIEFEEVFVYKTKLNRKKLNIASDAILFFSPSSIESYSAENKIGDHIAFCIGNTTAIEAKKHTDKIIIPPKSTVEDLLAEVLKHYST